MRCKFFTLVIFSLVIISLIISGCNSSGSGGAMSPLAPGLESASDSVSVHDPGSRHALLSLYTCYIHPDTGTIDAVPMRESAFHLNALRFLEPPPPVRINMTNFSFDGQVIDVDISFLHPFTGLDKYSGFDVCGIVISSGSISGFSDPHLVVAGEGDLRLLNADGLTRWWNPREFPYNDDFPLWGYIDGNLGTPDDIANYTATLNGYKYHADGLDADDDLTVLNPDMRGVFTAGSANTRHYTIDIGSSLVFNYAIDACWDLPTEHPVSIPDSFTESANRAEPWLMSVDIASNTLYYDTSAGAGGGELTLDVHCYDWFNADQNRIRVESPGEFDPVISSITTGGTPVYSTYQVDIPHEPTSTVPIDIWVSAEAAMDYEGFLPGVPTSAYMMPFKIEVVESTSPGELVLVWNNADRITHPNQAAENDIDPALIVNGSGDVLLAFHWWQEDPYQTDHWINYPVYATSTDSGHNFTDAQPGQWIYHGVHSEGNYDWQSKFTLGSNGQAFFSYGAPCGHTLQAYPKLPVLDETCSHSGTIMEHAGEMLYTADGYPMMFGDLGGTILMRRGDYPNQAGTMTWPTFQGTQYTIVAEGNVNYLSLSRSTGKTSDGICHLVFWHGGLPYIREVHTTDTTGTSWTEPADVYTGLAEVWVGGKDPSLWIDNQDAFHVTFVGEYWWGEYTLMYLYDEDGENMSEMDGGNWQSILAVPVEDGLNDAQVVTFDAFDKKWVFISYETGGNVYTVYKALEDEEFSDPILVSEHENAALPDLYPNGDTGVIYAYEADDGSGMGLTDIYHRLAWFELQ